jgi:dUTP pyrophosphatase
MTEDKKEEIEKGDVVALLTGGVDMVVTNVEDDVVTCTWGDDEEDEFVVDKLTKVKELTDDNTDEIISIVGSDDKTINTTITPTTCDDTLYFAKVSDTAIIPTKRKEDAGYDIYANMTKSHIDIPVGGILKVPTGIATAFNDKFVFITKERGSTGTQGMEVRCGVFDSGFRNEHMIVLSNATNKHITISTAVSEVVVERKKIIYPASKAIAQGCLIRLGDAEAKEISYDELVGISSERGNGMLGSSGK